jgi:hypothetical protein
MKMKRKNKRKERKGRKEGRKGERNAHRIILKLTLASVHPIVFPQPNITILSPLNSFSS